MSTRAEITLFKVTVSMSLKAWAAGLVPSTRYYPISLYGYGPFLLVSFRWFIAVCRAFWKHRIEFNELLAANHKKLVNRYFRLMALPSADIICTTPFAMYFMYLNLTTESLAPWVSWSDTKWGFSRVETYPAWVLALSPEIKSSLDLNIWLFPSCAFLFFAFFGLAQEARRNYTTWSYFIDKPCGIRPKQRYTYVPNPYRVDITKEPSSKLDTLIKKKWNWDTMSFDMTLFEPTNPGIIEKEIETSTAHDLIISEPASPVSAISESISSSCRHSTLVPEVDPHFSSDATGESASIVQTERRNSNISVSSTMASLLAPHPTAIDITETLQPHIHLVIKGDDIV
ncbi:hypothetical protein M422DRAFT_66560 [Sphaerobolus stellatus SS14]|nr:hypothetical protein M422DRAFT_66560 [Sphaerobolus stellatus SS14]